MVSTAYPTSDKYFTRSRWLEFMLTIAVGGLLFKLAELLSMPGLDKGLDQRYGSVDASLSWVWVQTLYANYAWTSLPQDLRAIAMLRMAGYPLTLDSFFQGTENLTDVLEVVHYSRAGMLQRLSELSLFWSMLPDPGVPDERLQRWFKPAMAEACIATVNDQPLTAAHIAELVWWLLGYRLPVEQFEALAGNIDFVTIQRAIQRCCMERSQRDQAVTQLAVMQALYAAVQ